MQLGNYGGEKNIFGMTSRESLNLISRHCNCSGFLNHKLRVTSYKLRVASYDIKITSYELKSTEL